MYIHISDARDDFTLRVIATYILHIRYFVYGATNTRSFFFSPLIPDSFDDYLSRTFTHVARNVTDTIMLLRGTTGEILSRTHTRGG